VLHLVSLKHISYVLLHPLVYEIAHSVSTMCLWFVILHRCYNGARVAQPLLQRVVQIEDAEVFRDHSVVHIGVRHVSTSG